MAAHFMRGTTFRRYADELLRVADGRIGEKPIAVVVPDPGNLRKLKAFMISPQGAPTEGYIFSFDITLPDNYPYVPPRVYMDPPLWHPKINLDGKNVCLNELYSTHWNPRFRLELILMSIQVMLRDPGEDLTHMTVVNHEAADQYLSDRSAYNAAAKKWAADEKHNEGYGPVKFEDIKMSAIQSVLKVTGGVARYKGSVFCQKISSDCWQLELVVIPQLTVYREGVEQLYPVSEHRKLTEFEFYFEGDEITFDVGREGSTSLDQCWGVTPLSEPKIEKQAVDKFDPRKSTPAVCKLRLTWLRKEMKPQRLIHQFKIKGSKAPLKSFSICLDPKGYSVDHSSEQSLERPTMPALFSVPVSDTRLKVSFPSEIGSSYFDFGVFLLNDVTGAKVECIRQEMRDNAEGIVKRILMEWLDGRGKQPVTWETLTQAIDDAKLSTLAQDIRSVKI